MLTIRLGSKGEDVKALQKALGITIDGVFGQNTHNAVVAFQKANGLVADGIVGSKTWAMLIPQTHSLKKSKRKIDYIVVHCSDTPEGRNNTIDDIRRWHTLPKPRGNGWVDVGYHYVVHLDGSVHEGRNVDWIGAHCEGYNANSIGICYVGGKSVDMKQNKDTRTSAQKEALLKLLKELRLLYPNAKIVGHRDLDKKGKTCPNFDAKNEYKMI